MQNTRYLVIRYLMRVPLVFRLVSISQTPAFIGIKNNNFEFYVVILNFDI